VQAEYTREVVNRNDYLKESKQEGGMDNPKSATKIKPDRPMAGKQAATPVGPVTRY